MRLARLVGAVMLVLAVCAHAEDRGKAREHFKRGSQHFKLGEYAEALVSFKEAYRAFEDPSILFNIAQCQRQLNQKPDAIRSYKTYLLEMPRAPNREEVRQVIGLLEAAVAQENTARITPPSGTLGGTLPKGPEPEPTPTVTPQQPVVATTTRAADRPTPIYKKAWFWGVIGASAAVAIGVGVGVGVALTPGPSAPAISPRDGVIQF
jgi:tetratricopeptide (TPR) repeat protein